jgi:hypothetical protein
MLTLPSLCHAVQDASTESVAKYSEITQLRDHFSHQRLREGKYTAGQIDTRWSDPIEKRFYAVAER